MKPVGESAVCEQPSLSFMHSHYLRHLKLTSATLDCLWATRLVHLAWAMLIGVFETCKWTFRVWRMSRVSGKYLTVFPVIFSSWMRMKPLKCFHSSLFPSHQSLPPSHPQELVHPETQVHYRPVWAVAPPERAIRKRIQILRYHQTCCCHWQLVWRRCL